jgi:hypothetical protein
MGLGPLAGDLPLDMAGGPSADAVLLTRFPQVLLLPGPSSGRDSYIPNHHERHTVIELLLRVILMLILAVYPADIRSDVSGPIGTGLHVESESAGTTIVPDYVSDQPIIMPGAQALIDPCTEIGWEFAFVGPAVFDAAPSRRLPARVRIHHRMGR